MTDLNDLKAMVDNATPRPDAARRAANITRAHSNFAALHKTAHPAAVTRWAALKAMLAAMITKGGLTATTAVVACGFLLMTPQGQDLLRAPSAPQMTVTEFDQTLPEVSPAPALAEAVSMAEIAAQSPTALEDIAENGLETATVPQALHAAPPAPLNQGAPSAVTDRLAMAAPPKAGDAVIVSTPDTAQEPVAMDVSTDSYAAVRSSLLRGQLPPRDDVRIAEIINSFPYAYRAPDAGDAALRTTVTTFQTPWNANTRLVHIALQGRMPDIAARPPLNLVVLIDTSGDMNDPARLASLQQSFGLILDQLRPQDQVAIVEYPRSTGPVLAPTTAAARAEILQALETLGTNRSMDDIDGLEQAARVTQTMAAPGEVSRTILATGGGFIVRPNDPDATTVSIADKSDTDPSQRFQMDRLLGALFPIADDVKLEVTFDPARIAEYRLIGDETRAMLRENVTPDTVDAGTFGAGHGLTAIYEVTPVRSPSQVQSSDALGDVTLHFKEPGANTILSVETPVTGITQAGTEANFAAAIAGFAQLLRDPQYLGDWGFAEAIALATENRGEDAFGYRAQAVQVMRLAESLSR